MGTEINKLDEIYNILKQDNRFISEDGSLLKNKIYELGMKMDVSLLKLLYNNPLTRDLFFVDIDGVVVFDKIKFGWIVSSRDFLPDSYTKFSNNIMLIDEGGNCIKQISDVVLSFPFKDCYLEADSTEETEIRPEVFYNEILMKSEIDTLLSPKVFTNAKRYTINSIEENIKIDNTDNLIIKGNNLLALYSLLPRYRGQVKCMYWDVLYNTDNDQVPYNDSFKHSSWLVMMKNRLEVAYELLSNDGVIFISINHVEMAYLSVLLDEVFGRNNKLPIITLKAGTTASYRSINVCPVNVTEYVLGYAKSPKFETNNIYRQVDYSEDYSHFIENYQDTPESWKLTPLTEIVHKKHGCNNWREFKDKYGIKWKSIRHGEMADFAYNNKEFIVSLNTLQKPSKNIASAISKSKIIRNKVIEVKRDGKASIYCYNGRTLAFFLTKFHDVGGEYVPAEILTNLWNDISFLGIGPEGGVSLNNGKKPEKLIQTILSLVIKNKEDIFLDAYLGSGTSAAVAHKMGVKYIGIEQLNEHVEKSIKRLNNVIRGDNTGISEEINWKGGGSFVYCEFKENEQAFIDKIIKSNESELISIYKELKANSFVSYRVDINKLEKEENSFSNLSENDKRKFLLEVIDKNMLYVNYYDINDEEYHVSENDKLFNDSFYKRGEN